MATSDAPADPSYPDHRDGDRGADLARRQHADREQCRPAHAARTVAQSPFEHAGNRVHQCDGVRPFLFRHARHPGDVGEHRRQLHHDGTGGDRPAAAHQLAQTLGGRAELKPTGTGVRARRVDLERGDHREIGEACDHPRVVLNGRTGDVHQHPCAPRRAREPAELVLPHGVETRVRQAHGIQHPARELGDPRRASSAPRLRSDRFRDDPTKGIEVDHTGHFAPEAGGAGSEEDGVLERGAEQPDRGGRGRHRPLAGAAIASLRSNSSR